MHDPVPPTSVAVQRAVDPIVNSTPPVGVPAVELTLALSVTAWPAKGEAGLAEATIDERTGPPPRSRDDQRSIVRIEADRGAAGGSGARHAVQIQGGGRGRGTRPRRAAIDRLQNGPGACQLLPGARRTDGDAVRGGRARDRVEFVERAARDGVGHPGLPSVRRREDGRGCGCGTGRFVVPDRHTVGGGRARYAAREVATTLGDRSRVPGRTAVGRVSDRPDTDRCTGERCATRDRLEPETGDPRWNLGRPCRTAIVGHGDVPEEEVNNDTVQDRGTRNTSEVTPIPGTEPDGDHVVPPSVVTQTPAPSGEADLGRRTGDGIEVC